MLSLMMAVTDGGLCSILPGALVAALPRPHRLRVRALVEPQVQMPISFMTQPASDSTRALQAAVKLIESEQWQQQCADFAGALTLN